MTDRPAYLMADPAHFQVSYEINPWMRPEAWSADPAANRLTAHAGWRALKASLESAGGVVHAMPGVEGLPDIVFPANAAVVLNGKAVVARFRHGERSGEEPYYLAALHTLRRQGVLDEVVQIEGCYQEGAGDCIWDANRQLFWAGFGQRSARQAADETRAFFGQAVTPLELVSPRFYHLDVCFCPLSGGEILYYPPAFSPAALAAIRDAADPDALIEATDDDAARFNVNAVNIGGRLVMASATPNLVARLAERGYEVMDVDLGPFIMAGGGAYCMTLRLDRKSAAAGAAQRAAE